MRSVADPRVWRGDSIMVAGRPSSIAGRLPVAVRLLWRAPLCV